MKTSGRHGVAISACALLFIVGSALAATAQTSTVGGRAPGASTTPGSSGAGGRLILYGTPGNCPPTIACETPREPREPPRLRRSKICDRWMLVTTPDGNRVRKCVER
ncbi:MAG: hypothetical protein GX458_10330 [Phyllobacteriaceae bacterium]|nr:hypothetical protein [Phyllobacteriaceae bacterium]